MSTFNGIIEEFPRIRIDYFRKNPDRPSPLACFLSHVHSDHLSGLESLRAPFIYCSAATKEILLRIEKYPHRMNFSKGILETRKQHYKHLANLLRPIPLQVPTEIELTPRSRIRVTLFDANHCIGAVMFLIEGDGKAILYTGDIRAETWWVDGLVRNPVLIPYSLGNKRLDKIYLDTTFATTSNIYRTFPSKAEGIQELLQKVGQYPEDTIFYFRSWTFGYEEVWLALSAALGTPVHVDRYQIGLYKSLAINYGGGFGIHEAPYLYGFKLGNSHVAGCLTGNHKTRIHSCEPGVPCSVISSGPSIFICPIVNRAKDGSKIPERGAGGGGGDLYQSHELELPDEFTFQQLEKLCHEEIQDPSVLATTIEALSSAFKSKNKTLSLDTYGLKEEYEIPLKELVAKLSRGKSNGIKNTVGPSSMIPSSGGRNRAEQLPRSIEFPYSRHSSYDELLNLIKAFRPKDIFPCTVDEKTWRDEVSMQKLFGHLCSGEDFAHDRHMRETIDQDSPWPRKRQRHTPESESQPRTDEMENEGWQSTSQSFISTTGLDNSNLSKRKSQAYSPEIIEAPISAKGPSVQVVNSQQEQYISQRGTKRTHETISSSPPSSFSPPHTCKLHAIRHALKNVSDRDHMDNQATPHSIEEPPPLPPPQQQQQQEDDEATDGEPEGKVTPTPADNPRMDIIEIDDEENHDAASRHSEGHVGEQGEDKNGDIDHESNENGESQNTMISYSAFESQDSQLIPQDPSTRAWNIRDRVEAYKGARNGDWFDYALTSTGNNHTEEIEL